MLLTKPPEWSLAHNFSSLCKNSKALFLSTKHSYLKTENIFENDHWFSMKDKSLCSVFEVFQYFFEKQQQYFYL